MEWVSNAMKWASNLVFRCMLLEQTPVCCNSFQFANNPRVLEVTIRHPDFYNTEILLWWNRDSIYDANYIQIGWNGFTHRNIWKLFPCTIDFFVRYFIGKATSISILWVFPHRNNTGSHQEQHTVHNELGGQNFKYGDSLFCRIKFIYLFITWSGPIGIMRKMSP